MFAFIPTAFYFITAFQIQFLVFMQSLYIIYYFKVEPYESRYQMRTTIYNEICIMTVYYHLFTFTKMADSYGQFVTGYSFVFVLLQCVLVNLVLMVRVNILSWKHSKRINKARQKYQKLMKEYEEMAELRRLRKSRAQKIKRQFNRIRQSKVEMNNEITES
jgi:hypothetical protein